MPKISAEALTRPGAAPGGSSTLQAQQSIGQLTGSQAGKLGPGEVSGLAAGVQKQQGQAMAQKAENTLQKHGQRSQTGINRTATQQRAKMSERRDNARRIAMASRQRIASMGKDLDQKLFQDRMQFDYDSRGVKFANTRQIADFQKMIAKDDEEYQNFAQTMQQRSTEKRKILQLAQAKISQHLAQVSQSRESAANFEKKKSLLQSKAAIDRKIKEEAGRAKNTAMIFQGIGTVAGAMMFSNPVLGAAVGSAVGSGAAVAWEKK